METLINTRYAFSLLFFCYYFSVKKQAATYRFNRFTIQHKSINTH